MSIKETIEGIVAGSAAINRMRQEIEIVVGTVVSLVPDSDLRAWRKAIGGEQMTAYKAGQLKAEFRSLSCKWTFSYYSNVELFFGEHLVYSSLSNKLTMRNVQRVHEALPTFVELMIRTFPGLSEQLRPLLDAAEK